MVTPSASKKSLRCRLGIHDKTEVKAVFDGKGKIIGLEQRCVMPCCDALVYSERVNE